MHGILRGFNAYLLPGALLLSGIVSCTLNHVSVQGLQPDHSGPEFASPVPLQVAPEDLSVVTFKLRNRMEFLSSVSPGRARIEVHTTSKPRGGAHDPLRDVSRWTLTIIPSLESRGQRVSFRLLDTETGEEVAKYQYELKQTMYSCILFLPLLPLNFLGPDSITISNGFTSHSVDAPMMEAVLDRFESDLRSDLSDPEFRARFMEVDRPRSLYVLLPLEGDASTKERRDLVYDSLEAELSENGVALVERRRLQEIMNEQALHESGLTIRQMQSIGPLASARYLLIAEVLQLEEAVNHDDPFQRKGEFKLALRCVDAESGVVVWRLSIDVNGYYHPRTEWVIDAGVGQIVFAARQKGYLN